jgi:hypothetical protein
MAWIWKGTTTSFPIIYFVITNGVSLKWHEGAQNSQFHQIMNPTNLRVQNFYIYIPIYETSRTKLQPIKKKFKFHITCSIWRSFNSFNSFLDFNGLKSNCQFDFYPFFCHIFLLKIPNGKYKLIFDIYVLGLSNGISKAHF